MRVVFFAFIRVHGVTALCIVCSSRQQSMTPRPARPPKISHKDGGAVSLSSYPSSHSSLLSTLSTPPLLGYAAAGNLLKKGAPQHHYFICTAFSGGCPDDFFWSTCMSQCPTLTSASLSSGLALTNVSCVLLVKTSNIAQVGRPS